MKKRPAFESIEFRDVGYKTDGGKEIFAGMNFEFPLNQIIWIRDEVGTSKSILMRLLTGLLLPTTGEYRVNGQVVNEMTFEEFVPYRCNMGFSFEFGGLINNRDIIGNLMLATEYHKADFGDPDELVARLNNYLDVFDLKGVAHERPSAIVGSSRKAAVVARAFIHEPEWLLMDDPTPGLRTEVKTRLRNLILEKRARGELKHVFIASEDAEFMRGFASIIVDIKNGTVQVHNRSAA